MYRNQGVHCTHNGYSGSILYGFFIKPRFPPPWTSQPTSVWSCTTVARTRGWCWAARLLVRQVCWEGSQSWWRSGILANHLFWLQRLMIDYLKTRHWSCQEGWRTRPLGSLRQAFSKFRHRKLCFYLFSPQRWFWPFPNQMVQQRPSEFERLALWLRKECSHELYKDQKK